MRIAITMTSASRPQCFPWALDSLMGSVKWSGKARWILHEDVLDLSRSKEVIAYAKARRAFDIELVNHKDTHGLGFAIGRLLGEVNEPYMFRWEDDWTIEREIDLDRLVEMMEKCKDVNQIIFNKRANQDMHDPSGFHQIEQVRDGITLTLSPHWGFMPALWRVGFAKPKWKSYEYPRRAEKHITGYSRMATPRLMVKKVGAYFLGGHGERRYLKHLAKGHSAHKPGGY